MSPAEVLGLPDLWATLGWAWQVTGTADGVVVDVDAHAAGVFGSTLHTALIAAHEAVKGRYPLEIRDEADGGPWWHDFYRPDGHALAVVGPDGWMTDHAGTGAEVGHLGRLRAIRALKAAGSSG